MAKNQQPINALEDFLPAGSFPLVLQYLNQYKVALTVSKARKTILGNYKTDSSGIHRISVNGNLNPYSFIITLIHELAHLLTYDQYRHHVLPHGKEWQLYYSQLLSEFTALNIFPEDILRELHKTMKSPAASCAGEVSLMRVLRRYDPHQEGISLLEELPTNSYFQLKDGRLFQKGLLRRKRFVCRELQSGVNYLINGMCEVQMVR